MPELRLRSAWRALLDGKAQRGSCGLCWAQRTMRF